MPAGFSLFTKDFARSVHHPRLAVAIREAIQEDFGKPPTKCALLSPEATKKVLSISSWPARSPFAKTAGEKLADSLASQTAMLECAAFRDIAASADGTIRLFSHSTEDSTANAILGDSQRCLHANMGDYSTKPSP